jgi:NCS1 family nucleobase:cation symporter-1
MLALLIATLSTNLAANVVSPANGFSNLAPRWISFRTGAMATAVIGILIMPWRLMTDLSDYIFVWLIGYSALLGPIAGIMLCDYFLIRKTELNAEALYDPEGEYAGVSWPAMAALVLAVLPNLPGFINAATGTAGTDEAFFHAFFDQIYGYAWFVGLPLAMIFYWLFKLMQQEKGN